jgi:diguanylate cyclase (GGDEF)-like protein
MPMSSPFNSLLPRTLAGRVFAVFALTLLVFLTAALGAFYRYQFLQHVEESQDDAGALVEVAAQAVEDSVVVGDYDTVKRTLDKILVRSPFKSASFTDVAGGAIRVDAPHVPIGWSPRWLQAVVGAKLFDVNRIANIGGRDYGVIRLSFDERKIAARLWALLVQALCLSGVAFSASLFLMRSLLRHWLRDLGRLRSFESTVAAGEVDAEASIYANAPLEIEEAIKAVNRTAASMRSQYGERIDQLMNSLVQHKSAMDQVAIVCEVDTAGLLLAVNDQFVRNLGLPRAALLGRPLAAAGAVAGRAQQAWTPSPEVWHGEVEIAAAHGTRQWYRTIVPIFGAGGAIEKYICIDIDISERKEFERTIVENAHRQTLIAAFGRKALGANDLGQLLRDATSSAALGLGASHAGLFEYAAQGDALVLREGSGWPAELLGATFAPHGAAPCPPDLAAAFAIRSGVVAEIVCPDRVFGLIGVYSDSGQRFSADDVHFLESLANILATALERHTANSRLTWLAQNDALTNLPNRRHLTSCIENALDRAQRAAVLFIDLDRFKRVNDMLGHAVGDQLLEQAGRRLLDCVDSGTVVARLGGDEFAIVLAPLHDPADAAAIATRVIDALALPFHLQGHEIFVSASVGIACHPEHGASADLLLKSADMAMYSAKNSGRNTWQFYVAEMNQKAAQRLRMENQLRLALERGQFMLHYQPKAALAGGAIEGFEALLRWHHPELGQVPPLEFISILEDTGLIIPIGEWVIGEVCRQLAAWSRAPHGALPVAINLSVRQLQQAGLAATVERIVGQAGVDPRLLEFELTESMLMADPEAAVATLSELKGLGMRLSVDDFGTGYSSLAYLKRFPLDALKIDRTFVRDLPGDLDDAAITRAVIRMAHSLGLEVVAEGVETVEQLRVLDEYGCDQIQGYYVGRPVPPAECERFLGAGRQPYQSAA